MADEVPNAVIVERLEALTRTVNDLRTDLKSHRSEFVAREVWDEAWKAMGDWKVERGVDIADLQAEQARLRRQVRDDLHSERSDRISGQRFAITVGVSLGAVVASVVSVVINAMGLGVS